MTDPMAPPDPPDPDDDTLVWRRLAREDVPALVAEWVAYALQSILDSRDWTPAERAEIVTGATPIMRAFYSGYFSALVGPAAPPDVPPLLHS